MELREFRVVVEHYPGEPDDRLDPQMDGSSQNDRRLPLPPGMVHWLLRVAPDYAQDVLSRHG